MPVIVVTVLSALVGVLALVASAVGLLSQDGASYTITTLRGHTAEIYGQGLYRYDTLLGGSGYRGVDAVTMAVAIPLLAGALRSYRRGSLRGALLLSGVLAYFLYNYASLGLGAAWNAMFLAYVGVFFASLFALIVVLAGIDRAALAASIGPRMPRRGIAAVLLASVAVLSVVWLVPAVMAIVENRVPDRMEPYTTHVTWVLDIGIILPVALIGGLLVRRGEALGYLIAAPTLVLTLMLGPALTAMTVAQVLAGVSFTPNEVIGPVVGFLVLAGLGMVAAVRLLRNIDEPTPRLTEASLSGARTAASGA